MKTSNKATILDKYEWVKTTNKESILNNLWLIRFVIEQTIKCVSVTVYRNWKKIEDSGFVLPFPIHSDTTMLIYFMLVISFNHNISFLYIIEKLLRDKQHMYAHKRQRFLKLLVARYFANSAVICWLRLIEKI